MPDFQRTADEVKSGTEVVDEFIDAVATLERDGDNEPIAALYAETARCGNVIEPERFEGPDGAGAFWGAYRSQFADITSTYQAVVVDGACATLEWQSEATIDDESLTYRGVTVLEFDDGRIVRSCAYFDPSAIARQVDSIASTR